MKIKILDEILSGLLALNFENEHQVDFEKQNNTLLLTFKQYGDLPVIIAVSDTQILVESVLVERDEFETPSEIDLMLLKAHKYIPLSTIAVESISGRDFYVLFGALSISSAPQIIAEELIALVKNTMNTIDALEPYYRFNKRIEKHNAISQGELKHEYS